MGIKDDVSIVWSTVLPAGGAPLANASPLSGAFLIESVRDLCRSTGHIDESKLAQLAFDKLDPNAPSVICLCRFKDHDDTFGEKGSGAVLLMEVASPLLVAPIDGRLRWRTTMRFQPRGPDYIKVKGGGIGVGVAAAICGRTSISVHTNSIPDMYFFEGNAPPPMDAVDQQCVCEVAVRKGDQSTLVMGLKVWMFARNGARVWLDQGEFWFADSMYEYRAGYPGDWVPYEGGGLPVNSVEAGHISDTPYPVYVGRIYTVGAEPGTNGNLHPGKVAFYDGRWSCFIGNGGVEERYDRFEVLVANPQVSYSWQPAENSLPANAVPGGYCTDTPQPLYVGRAYDGNIHAGKVAFYEGRWSCFIGNGGAEQRYEKYEVLCISPGA